MPRKKMLFIIDTAPAPIDCGQRVRIKGLTEACCRAAEVSLVAPRPKSDDDRLRVEAQFKQVFWVEDNLPVHPLARVAAWLAAAARVAGLPTPAKIAAMAPLVRAIDRADPSRFDLIWAERPHVATLCAAWKRKLIVDLDDLEHLKIAGQIKLVTSWVEKLTLAYRHAFYRRLETVWTRSCLASVVCSRQDKAYLAAQGCANILVVPNGAGMAVAPGPLPRPDNAAPRLLFLANLAYGPNADALGWLEAEIMPRILADDPGASLDVIGPNPASDEVSGGVRHLGFVDDLAAVIGRYDALIAPLRYGGGTKLKVLDAMARGAPVVTTRIGAEGLGLTDGVNVLLAETPDEFAECVRRLRADPDWGERIATNARDHVARTLTWPAIQSRLAAWLRNVQPHKPAPATALLELAQRFIEAR